MLKIGDFSRLVRVTIKTLRHYDAVGLLRPDRVDAATGYRYYSAMQVPRLQWIVALKDLGFSLDEIRDSLADGQESRLHTALLRRRGALLEEIADGHERLRRVDAMLRGTPAGVSVAAVVRQVPECQAYALRCTVDSLGQPVEALFEQAEAAVAKAQARIDRSPFLLFHDPEHRDRDIDVEVCIPVADEAAPRLTAVRRVAGASDAGCLTYEGSYARTPALAAGLAAWIDAGGYVIAGPLREVYHRFGADQRGYRLPAHRIAATPDDYITELQIPLVRRDPAPATET
jgi:DNA-binding transcriptional MerR regulator